MTFFTSYSALGRRLVSIMAACFLLMSSPPTFNISQRNVIHESGWASVLFAQGRDSDGPQFCSALKRLVEASEGDFRAIRRQVTHSRDSEDWISAITLPGAQSCEGSTELDNSIPPNVTCELRDSPREDALDEVYVRLVRELKTCLPKEWEATETRGGKAARLFTPIKRTTLEKKGNGYGPDGPSVDVSITLHHRPTRSPYYSLDVDVNAKDRE